MKTHHMPSARSGILSHASDVLTEHVWPLTILSLLCSGGSAVELWAAQPSGFYAVIMWLCLGYFAALAVVLPLKDFAENARIRKRLSHLTKNERIVMDAFALGKIKRYRTDPRDECVKDLIADGLLREIRIVSVNGKESPGFVLTSRAAKQMDKAYPFPPLNGPF
jgi:hypothetical protein